MIDGFPFLKLVISWTYLAFSMFGVFHPFDPTIGINFSRISSISSPLDTSFMSKKIPN